MNTGLVIPADPKLRDANRKANREDEKKVKPQPAPAKHRRVQHGSQRGNRFVALAAVPLGVLAGGLI